MYNEIDETYVNGVAGCLTEIVVSNSTVTNEDNEDSM